MIHRLEELRPRELEARLAEQPALVMALGTIEWHSHHLPLGLDLLKAQALAERVAERTGAVLAPPAWWAAGGVPQPLQAALPAEVTEPRSPPCSKAGRDGLRGHLVVNGHYGLENSIAVRRAAIACSANTVPVADYELLTDLGAAGDHAGLFETALLLPGRPDLVALDQDDLPGVIGADPRDATTELGAVPSRWPPSGRQRFSRGRAEACAALAAGLAALERIWELRQELPREEVPPVQPPRGSGIWRRSVRAGGQMRSTRRSPNGSIHRPEGQLQRRQDVDKTSDH